MDEFIPMGEFIQMDEKFLVNELQKENQCLRERISLLEAELNETKEHLKKYTAPERSKIYYENHK